MITDVADLGETSNIERLCAKLRHAGDGVIRLRLWLQDEQYAQVRIADADAKIELLRMLRLSVHSERALRLSVAPARARTHYAQSCDEHLVIIEPRWMR